MIPEKDLFSAVNDYYYLLNKKYPEKSSLKLVGDRYGLSRDERNILYRGVCSSEECTVRKARRVLELKNKSLAIDAYNVICTIMNYRMGKKLFISLDTFLRDAGSTHGKIKNDTLFEEAVRQTAEFLSLSDLKEVFFYYDSPVSHSSKHKEYTERLLDDFSLKGECFTVKSADYVLKRGTFDIIATSDSNIIENASALTLDLARLILEKVYKASFPRISDFLM